MKLFGGYHHEITFSRIDTILLPPNYVTNCRNYDINDKEYENMRSDCISKCFVDSLQKICPHCYHLTEVLLRKEVFSKYRSDKYCPNFDDKTGDYMKHLNCYERIFEKLNLIAKKNVQKIASINSMILNLKRKPNFHQLLSGTKLYRLI